MQRFRNHRFLKQVGSFQRGSFLIIKKKPVFRCCLPKSNQGTISETFYLIWLVWGNWHYSLNWLFIGVWLGKEWSVYSYIFKISFYNLSPESGLCWASPVTACRQRHLHPYLWACASHCQCTGWVSGLNKTWEMKQLPANSSPTRKNLLYGIFEVLDISVTRMFWWKSCG